MEISAEKPGSWARANWMNLTLGALAFAPLLWNFFILSWNRPAYQFFPMALLAAGMLAWREVHQVGRVAPGNLRITRWLAAAVGVACLYAYVRWSPWLGFMVFLAGLLVLGWDSGGTAMVKALVPALLVLAAIVPPPFGWDERLTLWLRSLAVHVSCALLDWLHITMVQDGNTIQLPGKTLFVEEACSGINSFILCNVFCLFWFLWQRRPFWWLLVALPATSLFVVLGNILRITICAGAYDRWQLDLLEGWRHETFGLVLLMGYCGLVLSLDQLLSFLQYSAKTPAAVGSGPTPPPAVKTSLPAWPGRPVFGYRFAGVILFVTVAGVCGAHVARHGRDSVAALPMFVSMPELKLALPETLAGWQRDSRVSGNLNLLQTAGVYSASWLFRRNGKEVTVAVDYPFGGFHDVRLCYETAGWQVVAEDYGQHSADPAAQYTDTLVLAHSVNHAFELHSDMDQSGNWISKQKFLQGAYASVPNMNSYRIQAITGGYAPVSEDSRREMEALFFAARKTLGEQMVDQVRRNAGK